MKFIDSHTGGEPTRVIIEGGPDLGDGDLQERLDNLRNHHDDFRSSVINEPRGWDAMVGALLCEPHDKTCDAGVIFFNNVGYLGMCGHGTIGLAVTLYEIGRVGIGNLKLETPVGVVDVELESANRVSIRNVPSYRYKKSVDVPVDGFGTVSGDIAWGGNWFFLIEESPVTLDKSNLKELTGFCLKVRSSLEENRIRGEGQGEIDHIELSGSSNTSRIEFKELCALPGRSI
jgi:4-hydroxyproline epimerase